MGYFRNVLLSFALFSAALVSSPTEAPPHPVFVYIQQSSEGILQKGQKEEYTLTLKGNSLNLVYFTDQPHRTTGQKNLTHFFGNWRANNHLAEHPPTAFINFNSFSPSNPDAVTPDILELREPSYDAESDTLTFKVQPLHDQPIQIGTLENVVIIYDADES